MKLKKSRKNSQSIKIFNGRKEADKILSSIGKKITQESLKPGLAVILVGKDKPSELYVKIKEKKAKESGIKFFLHRFEGKTKQEKIINKIKELNDNPLIHGIVVQLPLPRKINPDKVIKSINPKKDVDGFIKNSFFEPVLVTAIFSALKSAVRYNESRFSREYFNNKKILALVNSETFGHALKKYFNKKNIKINYFLIKNSSKKELAKKTKRADIIISVCGVPNLIKSDIIKNQSILIDAGISFIHGKKTVGDVDKKSVEVKASFLTPVPGGIGPLTVAFLLKNTYLAAKKYSVSKIKL